MRLIACLLLAALSAACAHRPQPAAGPAPFSLFTKGEDALSPRAFAEEFGDARFILIGESHDASCDHQVQAELIRALAPRSPAIGLEMVEVDRQPILDRFATGKMTVQELSEALDWNQSWGVDFRLYQPIFEAAAEASLPLVALNLPRELVRKVAREGIDSLSESERGRLPPLVDAPEAQQRMLRQAFEAHAGMGGHGEEGFQRFIAAQSLWDSQMAYRALQASETLGRPMVILAGGGHVAFGWGIASRLESLDPASDVVLVMPWRGGDRPDPDEADAWYVCPAH